jgi:hypothetical protein
MNFINNSTLIFFMKHLLFFFLFTCFILVCGAQLKTTSTCNTFVVDILDGKVNDVRPDFNNARIKTKLPCFTSEEAEGSAKCGGLVSYKDRDIYFYTGRDYVQIGPNFKGKLSMPLLGASRNGLFKWLGNPKLKDTGWDAFETQYGCLILYYTPAGKVRMIRFSTKTTDQINLCD